MTGLYDSYHRRIDYFRISVTDRCNLRCIYCADGSTLHLPRSEVLTYEEIERLVRVSSGLGVRAVRLTGGEPLLRPEVLRLVSMLRRVPGIDDVSMTTNGTLLARYAADLKQAGLTRVNVSLDSLRPERFAAITGVACLDRVLEGIEVARRAGLEPVKLNTVVMRGINDDEIVDFGRLTINEGVHIRFIEHMPVSANNGHDRLFTVLEMMAVLRQSFGELEAVTLDGRGPARYYRLPGARGTIGFIQPMTERFCAECNRFRLTADGHLRPCLLSGLQMDVKERLRNGISDTGLKELLISAAALKPEHHHMAEGENSRCQMQQIGG